MSITFEPDQPEVIYEITATARIEGVELPFRFRIKTRDWEELALRFNAWGGLIDDKLAELSDEN